MVRSNGDKILQMREAVGMTERVDDIPMLLAQGDTMDMP
jgi:hypothetical protein